MSLTCAVCDELRKRSINAKSNSELLQIREFFQNHRNRIRQLRMFYMQDIQRSQNDPTFQTIAFDGSDTRTCRCPQRWRAMLHNDTPENSFVEQKIQTVLVHGKALNMYVAMPFMECGASLTVSTILDALEYVDARVETVRFQFDGNKAPCNFFYDILISEVTF